MELHEFISLIKQGKKIIIYSVLGFLVFALILSFVQPLKYGATSRLLITQDVVQGTDPYVIARANEYQSGILSNVVVSNSFFSDVLDSGFNIDKNYFTSDPRKQMKIWIETVSAHTVSDTGIIEINVFHTDSSQADQISQAINYILKTKNDNYFNSGSKINVKVIDRPIVSDWPVKPNIPLNLVLGLVLGFFFGLSFVYVKSFTKKEAVDFVKSIPKNELVEKRNEAKVEEIQTIKFEQKAEPEPTEKNYTVYNAPASLPVDNSLEDDNSFENILQNGDMKNIRY